MKITTFRNMQSDKNPMITKYYIGIQIMIVLLYRIAYIVNCK